MTTTWTAASTITDSERAQIERANASTATPVVFIHGLWLLPSSWDNWGVSAPIVHPVGALFYVL